MNPTFAAAALAAVLALKGGPGAPPPAAPPASEDDWVTIKSDTGTYEFRIPPRFTELTPKKSGIVRHIQYAGQPYLSTQVKVYAYEGWVKAEYIDKFMKDMERQIGGNITYEGDSKTRFVSDIQASNGEWWISQVQGMLESGSGYAIECLVPKTVYDTTKDVWMKTADSFKAFPPPKDSYSVPVGWKAQKNAMYAVLGPVFDMKEKKDKDQLERRMAQVLMWLETDITNPQKIPATKMFRDAFSDERKAYNRMPVLVYPTAAAFKAAAGEAWAEGASALYLPDHPERIVAVDGSPDSAVNEEGLLLEAGIQYAETRIGRMWPWLRTAFRRYYLAAFRKGMNAGLFPPEMLKRAKEVFGKTATPFEDLMKQDEAGMKALGEDGAVSAWGILQFGLHGTDGPIRNMFRGLLRDGTGAPDLNPVWEKLVARYKEETKKPFKPAFIDAGAKKFFREHKEEKK